MQTFSLVWDLYFLIIFYNKFLDYLEEY